MSCLSATWIELLCRGRSTFSNSYTLPTLPWITPVVPGSLMRLFQTQAERLHYAPNALLNGLDRPIDHLMIVETGLTARAIHDNRGNTIAVSPSGHIACGNLNFFTQRPVIGHYYALTNSTVLSMPRDAVLEACRSDIDLMQAVVTLFECCTLSDRLGLCTFSRLNAEDRLKMLSCAWAINFGEIIHHSFEQEDWVKMPVPMTRQIRADIAGVSSTYIDKTLHQWKEAGLRNRSGEYIWARPKLYADVYRWMLEVCGPSREKTPETFEACMALPIGNLF